MALPAKYDELKVERRKRLHAARRIVIKLGTSIVTGPGGGVSTSVVPLARSIAELKRDGRQVVLVSSGAVGLGAAHIGLARQRLGDVVMRQACAAVGQSLLMHAYEELFSEHGVKIAQVLLTEDDFTDWRRYINLRRTIERLLKLGVLPVINENDTVSIAELEYVPGGARVFSDNDRLAALVMSKLEADALILLTNVDGLLARKPLASMLPDGRSEDAAVIPLLTEITPELRSLAVGKSAQGRGGMITKLEAAEIALRAGGVAIIANGTRPETLRRIFAGEELGTAFIPQSRIGGKRRWIAYAASVRGRVVVNDGAREAILKGKASLLSSGVVRIERPFEAMDVVSIVDVEDREFARGIANCGSAEATDLIHRQANKNGGAASKQESFKHRVLVTRDNIVLTDSGAQSASSMSEKLI